MFFYKVTKLLLIFILSASSLLAYASCLKGEIDKSGISLKIKNVSSNNIDVQVTVPTYYKNSKEKINPAISISQKGNSGFLFDIHIKNRDAFHLCNDSSLQNHQLDGYDLPMKEWCNLSEANFKVTDLKQLQNLDIHLSYYLINDDNNSRECIIFDQKIPVPLKNFLTNEATK